MATIERVLGPIRSIGRERLGLLGYITGGHTVIHWYQQLFPLILPSVKQSLGLNDAETGAMGTARQFGVMAFNLPSGLIADEIPRKRAIILASALVFMGLAYLLVSIAPGLIWALTGAVLLGLGTAVWHPPAMGALSGSFPNNRATALAVHGVGATFGDTITPLAVGGLLVIFRWQGVLQVHMIPALLSALILWRALAHHFAASGPPSPRGDRFRDMGRLLKNPVFIGVTSAQALMNTSRNTILVFLPLYIELDLGYSTFVLGVFISLLHVMGIPSQLALGVLSDRLGRKLVLIPSYVMLGVFYLALAQATSGWVLVLAVLAVGIFFYTLTNVTTAAVLDVAGSGIQSSTLGLTSVVTQVVTLPAPILIGLMTETRGYDFAFFLSALFMFIGALVLVPLRMHQGSHRTARFSG